MKSKFLQNRPKFSLTRRKVRQAIVIPTLTLILMAAQLAPQLFFSNEAVLDLINELPTTAVVYAAPLTEEQLEEYPDEAPTMKDVSKYNAVYNDERTLIRVRHNNPTGESEVYLSTHGYENYPELREALEDEYGLKFMLKNPDDTVMSSASRWAPLLKSKSERAKLAKIAAKYIPGIEEDFVAAPEIALATYYGAINDPWGYVKYKNNKAINRSQMCALVYRAWGSNWAESQYNMNKSLEKGMGKDYKYNLYLSICRDSMYATPKYVASNGKTVGTYTKKEMKSAATRIEVLYLAMDYYHAGDWGVVSMDQAKNQAKIQNAKKIFKDLKNSSDKDCLIANRLYELGLIKPDKEGNSNLYKKCSMSLALRYIYAAIGADDTLYRD